ncbi:MAG: hypothetical protein ACI9LG_002883 [Moritella dasanensis]|jgi:hypothetical protein
MNDKYKALLHQDVDYTYSVVNLLKVNTMRVKTFTFHLNYITKLLLDMTPAQREQVQQRLQETQPELTVNELIQPIFDMTTK